MCVCVCVCVYTLFNRRCGKTMAVFICLENSCTLASDAARARDLFCIFIFLLNAIKNIQNQCQLQNHENIIQMTQWDRFEGFGIVGCKKSVQVRFKVLTEHLETYICAKRILQEKWISLSENVSLSSLVKLWQPNKTSLYNKKKLCEEKACTKIKKSFQNKFVYVHSPKKMGLRFIFSLTERA